MDIKWVIWCKLYSFVSVSIFRKPFLYFGVLDMHIELMDMDMANKVIETLHILVIRVKTVLNVDTFFSPLFFIWIYSFNREFKQLQREIFGRTIFLFQKCHGLEMSLDRYCFPFVSLNCLPLANFIRISSIIFHFKQLFQLKY